MNAASATFMRREIEEIPAAMRRLLDESADRIRAAAGLLRSRDPSVIATVARGSSDHAATFLKYATEITAGVPVASLGPSLASIYRARLRLSRAACISISQSGRSPDIVAMARSAGEAGALTLALTNDAGSPLAEASQLAIDIKAGPEKSVAATKSFVMSIAAGLAILADWQDDKRLAAALAALPERLEEAVARDWSGLSGALDGKNSLFILGRGPAIAIAQEAALKFKETCGMHAEAYSAAEVLHGPVTIVRPGFPVIALAVRDAAEAAVAETVGRVVAQGADVFVTSGAVGGAQGLPIVETGHSLTDPLALVVSFYAFIEGLARHRGIDPDSPPNLRKVTETI